MTVFLSMGTAKADLWAVEHSQPPVEDTACVWYYGPSAALSAGEYVQRYVNSTVNQLKNQNSENVRVDNFRHTFTAPNDNCGFTISITYDFRQKVDAGNGDGSLKWSNPQQRGVGTSASGSARTGEQCDVNGSHPISRQVNSTLRCYSPVDLKSRDTCPNSLNDPDAFLPTGDNIFGRVCRTKDDGSRCSYTLSPDGTTYQVDLEGDCYAENPGEYESPTDQPDPNDPNCQTITNGNVRNTFCPANRDAVCSDSGVCPAGCGSFNIGDGEVFGCFTSEGEPNTCDKDGDGQPDDECREQEPEPPTEPVDCDVDPTNPECESSEPRNPEDPNEGEGGNIGQLLDPLNEIDKNTRDTKNAIDSLKAEQKKTTQAVLETSGAIVGLRGVNQGIAKDVGDIKDGMKGAGVTFNEVKPSGDLTTRTGFVERTYTDGFGTVLENIDDDWQASRFNNYLDSWNVTVGGGYSYPRMCFDVGSLGNYGCHDFAIDNRVFPFIRAVIIFTSLMLARRLVLGG